MSFVHLYGHSTYSLLESIGSLDSLLKRVKELWMKHVGIVDYSGMYWVVNFYKKAKDYEINPLIGVELTFVIQWWIQTIRGLGHTLCFLAKNFDWYKALLALVTRAYEHDADYPWIDASDLALVQENVYVFVWWTRSWVADQLSKRVDPTKIKDWLSLIHQTVWMDSLLFAIGAQDYATLPELEEVNNFLLDLSAAWKNTSFAATDFYYPTADHKYAAEVALAIKDGKKMYESDRRVIAGEHHIMSEQEVRAIMEKNWLAENVIDWLIEETWVIAESIKISIPLWQSLFPNYETSEEISQLYWDHKDTLVE